MLDIFFSRLLIVGAIIGGVCILGAAFDGQRIDGLWLLIMLGLIIVVTIVVCAIEEYWV